MRGKCVALVALALAASVNGQAPRAMSTQQIVAARAKAVVTVHTESGSGTGFFGDDGLLYTCFHVLEGCKRAWFVRADGSPGEIYGAVAADRERDIAALTADGTGTVGIPFGNYAALQLGAKLVVIGSPLGLSQTVTEGIVSSKREVGPVGVLQLSAPVSPGSSGSPVLNDLGQVVGMVTSSLSKGQQLNFAVSGRDLKFSYGVPLQMVFSRAERPSARPGPGRLGLILAPETAQGNPGKRDLMGVDSLKILVERLDEPLAERVPKTDVEVWLRALMAENDIPYTAADSSRGFQSKDEKSRLKEVDDSYRFLYVNINSLKDPQGTVSYSIRVGLHRAVLVYPGCYTLAEVDSRQTLGVFGAAVDARGVIRNAIRALAQELFDEIKAANLRKSSP